ncbi:hypothetical protein FPCIR_4210 [Fusarium pseudocircinatum]|uniref:Uncharacterized protein n=1 Tax=Fusarium pseudocircinatum TaxID=56676 RepID=A0A8H5PFW8_9HYPO|nr:hypothetical protein FPCIR_4210 [Fusarium pseudocircinatum]
MDSSQPVASYPGNFIPAMNQRLDQLYHLGVLRVKLQADEHGYPTFVAMPDKPLEFSAPSNYDRGDLSVTLQDLFTVTREEDIVAVIVTAFEAARSLISRDLELMDDFLARSTTSVTAQQLADGGQTLTRCPQAMARIIRYDGGIEDKQWWWDSIAHDVSERYKENSFKLINDFSDEMAQARDERVRPYALGNVAQAAEHVKRFVEWQLNADLMRAMNEAMNGFDWSSDNEQEMRSSSE